MTEKRKRRCGTCAAWNGSHSVEESGYCQANSPSGCDTPTFAVTNKNDWCLVDYTPIGLTIGVPDVEDLLLRIQNNYTEINAQRDRLNRLSTMLAEQQDKQPKPEPTSQCCGNCVHWLDMWGATESELSSERLGGCSFRKSTKSALHNPWMVEMPLVKMTETCDDHSWASPPSDVSRKEPSNET